MKADFETILDECISRIEAGEGIETCLADYPAHKEELQVLLTIAQDLYAVPVPQGSAEAWMEGQRRMLEKIDDSQIHHPADPTPGFLAPLGILTSQIGSFFTNLFPKEKIMLRKTAIAIILVVVVLLGSTTATALASQNALPGDALYSVKTAIEDLRVNTSWDTANEARWSIQYADRRIQEVNQLIERNRYDDVSAGIMRFEFHLREALDALAVVAQNDPQMAQELAVLMINLLDDQTQLINTLMENNPNADLLALQEALAAAQNSMDQAGSVSGLENENDGNLNTNINVNANDNDDMNENDDDMNENDDDDMNENDDDDMNENDDDDMNENDDDDMNENDDDDMNENDDDDMNENDDEDMNENDDDDMNENDDDDMNENDDDDMNENDDDMNENDDDNDNDDDDDDNENDFDDDDDNDNDDDDDNENDDDD